VERRAQTTTYKNRLLDPTSQTSDDSDDSNDSGDTGDTGQDGSLASLQSELPAYPGLSAAYLESVDRKSF
jgi:hypothetical protein